MTFLTKAQYETSHCFVVLFYNVEDCYEASLVLPSTHSGPKSGLAEEAQRRQRGKSSSV